MAMRQFRISAIFHKTRPGLLFMIYSGYILKMTFNLKLVGDTQNSKSEIPFHKIQIYYVSKLWNIYPLRSNKNFSREILLHLIVRSCFYIACQVKFLNNSENLIYFVCVHSIPEFSVTRIFCGYNILLLLVPVPSGVRVSSFCPLPPLLP